MSGSVQEILLPLEDVADLFNAPAVEPMSGSPVRVLGVSGIEYVLGMIHLDKAMQRRGALVVTLPPEKADGVDVVLALRRHVEARMAQLQRQLSTTYRYGWRVAGIAVVLLAICLGLSHVFASGVTAGMGPLLRKTMEYGFEIIGWVMLWHPIDLLGFVPLEIRLKIRDLRALLAKEVVVRADQAARRPSHQHSANSTTTDLAAAE
jgi:hypothetical protein